MPVTVGKKKPKYEGFIPVGDVSPIIPANDDLSAEHYGSLFSTGGAVENVATAAA